MSSKHFYPTRILQIEAQRGLTRETVSLVSHKGAPVHNQNPSELQTALTWSQESLYFYPLSSLVHQYVAVEILLLFHSKLVIPPSPRKAYRKSYRYFTMSKFTVLEKEQEKFSTKYWGGKCKCQNPSAIRQYNPMLLSTQDGNLFNIQPYHVI